MKWAGPKDLMRPWKGVPIWVWVVIAGGALYFLNKFRSGSSSGLTAANTGGTEPTSVVNSPNSPVATVTSYGHAVPQNISSNQVTPNEGPGTSPILNISGGYQYGGS